MRNTLKATTLESKFPLLSVEHGCIVSKDADITVGFRVELPELYTVTSAEYEAIHATWVKAMKVLPDYCIVHKQDIFIRETYKPDTDKEDMSFLSRSFERHFNERPYLNHYCYLFLTKTTKERSRTQSNFSTLCRGFIVPKEIKDKEAVLKFLESVGQFASILNESGFIRLEQLIDGEITGTDTEAGIIEKYFSLSQTDTTTLEDITLKADEMKIGDNYLCLHTLSDVEDLPGEVATDSRYEKLSTDRSDCRLSFAAPIGLLLPCNHIYNQYVFIDDSAANLQKFEKMAKNMHSLSRYSRSNQINKEWIDEYLNEAHSFGLTSVRCHCNVMAWSDDREELKRIRNEVGSQLAQMECKPRHNTVDTPTLFWAAIPGNAADFPAEESFYTFIERAVCFFSEETNYRNSPSPFGIKMVDRLTGKPLHLDISDLPMKRGVITNRNKFVLGPSGSGKSFFMNHLVRQYYEQGTHVVLVDTGNSYQGLCEMIHKKTKGDDGIYFTYTEEKPISFNPFYTDDFVYDVEKKDSIKTLLLTLWKSEDDKITKTESGELGSAVTAYIDRIKADRSITPNFNTFYEFMRDGYRSELESRAIKVGKDDFNIDNFLTTLRQYYSGGRYDFLLNSRENIDLLGKRFIVFEIDAIKENRELFPVVTIIIMEAFINKMRRLKGIRKQLIVEEAWKALSSASMSEYLKYLYKTVRKYFGEAIVVTQEVDDIISSPVVKEAIINNSDCKILLDQRKYMNKFDAIQDLLGLTDKERGQILSINMANNPSRLYKEVWIGLGGTQSAVYATEVSAEEYLTFTTEETEKMEVLALADKLGGIEPAIKQLADKKRSKN
ncbi:TraG family conjugative transposon ATPase [Parabacteroides bouchesdurhonensis]|uniref:TraG family conjugative transposon ATPase n=1 Tax=Parabacteroides bouchesdurhonensis TaxID=1936995 RepID=UPI000E4A433A|nr:TraG family conjugative transposon ATPase [Parabacteroides bouchesdurhonensis]RHJ95092.1 TraG family conjugative transposon ATPase [Bacteroides sp. AM07-16]